MRDAYDEFPDPDWLSPDNTPPTAPEGGQPPPPSEPPAAVGASGEEPPPPPRHSVQPWRRGGLLPEGGLAGLATQILDTLDRVGDRIAKGLGLR